MARTRAEIKTLVGYNTGRATEKAVLIEHLCDEALQVALQEHPFKDARSYPSVISITEEATSVDLFDISGIRHVLSATIIKSASDQALPLTLKNETWWNENVIEEGDNLKGWPDYGLRLGTTLYLNRPADSGLTLQLCVATDQTFADDDTECPIALADVFVTQYVTAFVFLSVEEQEKYKHWYNLAMGYQYVMNGNLGGTLKSIINIDKRDRAESMKAQRGSDASANNAIAVQNLITGHDDYGNVRLWSS